MFKSLGAVSVPVRIILTSWLLAGTASFSAPTTEQAGAHVPPPMDRIWCEAIVGDGHDVRMGKCSRRYRMPLMPDRPPMDHGYHFEFESQIWSFDEPYYPEPMPLPRLQDLKELRPCPPALGKIARHH